MRRIRFALPLAVCLLCAHGQEAVPKSEYHGRRAELRKAIRDGVVVLFGRTDRETDDWRTGFRQEPNFYYLSGWDEPGAILLLWPQEPGEMLFLPPRDARTERYMGHRRSAEDPDARSATGFAQVLSMAGFEAQFLKLLETNPKIYTLTNEGYAAKLRELAPLRDMADAQPALTKLRMKKSPAEVKLIERATEISIAAHRAAWRRIAPGLYEYQIAATMTGTLMDRGCERNAYAPIVASGPVATVLHYAKNSRRMDRGEMLLMDVGGECSAYASDLTRTVPVEGKFTARQRELYQIVLGAHDAAIRAVKPGVVPGADRTTPNSLYKAAFDYIDSHGKDRDGAPLGKYLTHGVSHHVGLEVHDPGAPAEPLAAGMVITIEPGLYIADERIGIRIEDIVLVTETGAKVLSSALPTAPDQIERAMASR